MKARRILLFATLALAGVVLIVAVLAAAGRPAISAALPYQMVAQVAPDPTPETQVNVLTGALDRMSWSAVIAVSLITLMLMFPLTLVGVAFGLSQVNPEYGQDSAEGGKLAIGAIIWIAVSNLVALFVGGWLSGYFAGVPDRVDGLLHGLMVWALTSLVTVLLVMSGLGRLVSGLAGLVNTGLHLTGSVVGGAARVAGDAVHTAGTAAGGALGAVGNLTTQSLSVLARGVQDAAQTVGGGVSQLTESALENTPDVQNALSFQDLSVQQIRLEAENLMRQAHRDPQRVEQAVNAAVNDVRSAAEHIVRHPEHTEQVLNLALQRVFRRGEAIANEVDRDALINLLAERSGIPREQAAQQVATWEEQFNKVKEQTAQARDIARQKAEEFRKQAEQRAQQIYDQAQARVEELQHEAEARVNEARQKAEAAAREAAQSAAETFSRVALAIAAVMVIGAIAAGIGGYIGTQEEVPVATIQETTEGARFDDLHGQFTEIVYFP
ncbi:MAG: hypothetical protein IPK19_04995 [Chloroflexi bacterium]|nr:hypothetical protein [Chloroflexota bacterium]